MTAGPSNDDAACKAVVALSKQRNDTVFQKTLSLNDFYLAGEGREWPLGNIQMVGKSNASAMKGEEPKLTASHPTGAWTRQPTMPWTSGGALRTCPSRRTG